VTVHYEPNQDAPEIRSGDSILRKEGGVWSRYEHGKRVEQLKDVTVDERGVAQTGKDGKTTRWGT